MFSSPYPRDVVRVSGPDASTYLHSQLSQDLRPMAVGGSAYSFLLEPTGKIVVLARVQRTADDEFVLDTDAGFGDAMVARLNRFKIRVKAEVEVLDWQCLAIRGEGADAVVGVPAWGGGVDLLGADVEAPAGCPVAGEAELLAARIAAVWPAMGAEIVPGEVLPAETGVTAVAVSFTKGCYPGQELVERMDSRAAKAPRLLQRVAVAEGTEVGAAYIVAGEVAGVVTSVLGIDALALVKRSALTE